MLSQVGPLFSLKGMYTFSNHCYIIIAIETFGITVDRIIGLKTMSLCALKRER